MTPDETEEPDVTDECAPALDGSHLEALRDLTILERASALRIRFGYAYLTGAGSSSLPPYYLTRLLDGAREVAVLVSTN